MKNLKKIILGCSCILFLSISNVAFASTGKVTGKTVRIRESADGSSNIITNAYRNDTVNVLEDSGSWYKVEYEGKTGYISKDFVEVKEENSNTVASDPTSENVIPSDNQTSEVSSNKETKIEKDANLKLLPNFSSRSLGVIQVGTEIEVKREVNNWIQITAGSNTGWILKNYAEGFSISTSSQDTIANSSNVVDTEIQDANTDAENEADTQNSTNQKAYINIDTARVRETAGGKIIGNLDINDVVTIIGEEGDWYKITCTEYPEGYVSKSLVTIGSVSSRSLAEERQDGQSEELDVGEAPVEEVVAEPEPQPEPEPVVEEVVQELVPEPDYNADLGSQVVAFAESFLGSPYVSGGSSPSGFDCSGFTSYVYSNFGYSLNRTASGQTANGMEVSRDDLQPGDIILFQDYGRSYVGHAAIYIGDGNFIHAANPSRGVVIDNLDSNSYYNIRFVTARRIV